MSTLETRNQETKHVKTNEFVLYLIGVFFYTTMTGMVGSYRNDYLINVLMLSEDSVSLYNTLVSIIPFVLSFLISMYIDGRKPGKKGKFKPITTAIVIPMAATLMLSFWVPPFLSGSFLMVYLVAIAVLWGAFCTLGNSINMIANVMTPNMKERDNIISFRSISSAVGNSAPLVIILVIAAIWKDDKQLQYIIGSGLCSVVGVITVLLGMSSVKERITYTAEKKNPFVGFKDVLTNKYAWAIIISDTLKNFRQVSNYMGIFLAGALLGSTDKFLFFGLPTGIGTAVGMLVINMLLKKFNSKVLYIASGIYSVIANVLAFAVGYMYFKTGSGVLQIVFIIFLFLIGLQFGASNLLPSMFQADVLEDIEAKTGKRIDATLPFVVSIGTLISGTIATSLAPKILYGDDSIIGYVQATEAVENPAQSLETKILLLFFYTIVHGVMMFLAGVPFFFYKLTGETKEEVHRKVLEMREKN
ncbi:MAG: MFS transporter [Clostridia bacterium]|nr:MFS transporter [Clostridia bacterium]